MRFERITVEPDKMGGVPCIRGLRIPVATVVGMLAEGMTAEEISLTTPTSRPATSEKRWSTPPRPFESVSSPSDAALEVPSRRRPLPSGPRSSGCRRSRRRPWRDIALQSKPDPALLAAALVEALLCEQLGADEHTLRDAHREQLRTGGVMDPGSETPNPAKLAEFLRWQTLRVGGPLREIAQDPATGPIPLAAANGADGLQRLLG